MRLIDADKLYEELKNHARNAKDMSMASVYNGIAIACGELNQAPTIDAEPVRHGHWEKKRKYVVGRAVDDDGWVELQELCSACGKWAKTQWRSPLYCPNCGAKMDERCAE